MKLEAGKFYKMRDGKKAYCLGETKLEHYNYVNGDTFVCDIECTYGTKLQNYFPNGNWFAKDTEDNGLNDKDIVEEWK
jgi:hypothetical protein